MEIVFMPSKMYILIKSTIPIGHAINCNGHGVLMAHLKWQHDPVYKLWLKESFKKVTCKVDSKTFNRFKKYKNRVIVTESRLDGEEVAVVFKPRPKFPKEFKELSLFK
jgi:hypothetical protein